MKYLSILIISLVFTSSCCGMQKVTQNQPTSNEDIVHIPEFKDTTEESSKQESSQYLNSEISDKDLLVTDFIYTEKLNNSTSFIKIASHEKWQELLQKHVSKEGNVDYKGFQKDKKDLNEYISYLSGNIPSEKWMKAKKLAYWINAYNALTIDLILRNYPTKSIKDIKDPWDQRLWKFGNTWQNLNDIEHKILREMDEPRIHFAIVCASVSCPKLQNTAFIASNLDAQLTNATKEFLADTSKNELSKDNIKISKIFRWFKKDFETNGSLIDFLNQYSEVTISESASKSYMDYDWDLNE